MRPRNVSKAIDHGQDDQAEGKRNPNVRDTSGSDFVNDNGARPRENQRECPEAFSRESFRHPDLRGLEAGLFAPLLDLRPDFVANKADLFELYGFAAL